ncbi:MAG TPA: hypothetical protein VD905_01410 [Flavobacteriales bacterium]|nr:hypothetical protein [Flavobacteriales bacterium]
MDEEVELVLKWTKGKPPYVGVLFKSAYVAGKLNQEWVHAHGNGLYKIDLEPRSRNLLLLTIKEPELGLKHTYKVKWYNPEKLKGFLYATRDIERMNFGHVLIEENNYKPVITTYARKLWVLPVSKLELVEVY